MTEVPSLWSFIANADWVVKAVLLLLLAASIASWNIILQRYQILKQAKRLADDFDKEFWSGIDLVEYYQQLRRGSAQAEGMAGIFQAGFHEYSEKVLPGFMAQDRLARVARSMQAVQVRCLERLSGHSDWLATIGSISPYVGLFGTVWGIMSAFRSLGVVQQASISMVAPGIAEALIATAIGLLVAIPAVVAFNRISTQLDSLEGRYGNFHDELLNILDRQSNQEQIHD